MHCSEYRPICRTLSWSLQKVSPGRWKAVGRHCLNMMLSSKPTQHSSYFQAHSMQLQWLFLRYWTPPLPPPVWVKKGSSPYARPEAMVFHMWPRDLSQLVASQAGLLFPDFLPRPGCGSLRNNLPAELATPPLASSPKDVCHPWSWRQLYLCYCWNWNTREIS